MSESINENVTFVHQSIDAVHIVIVDTTDEGGDDFLLLHVPSRVPRSMR